MIGREYTVLKKGSMIYGKRGERSVKGSEETI